ncbi:MAG: FtsH protease activity modulator HflK [Candidatus Lambdaproteobacteria bacterium]|nr:FtsH protease activity modulator HflK [Candidatus Lambdaproteobacteria bacterium]
MAGQFGGPNVRPADLEKTLQGLRALRDRLGGARKSWFYIVLIAVALWLLTGIYIVNPGELAVVRRFGAMVGTTQEGIHFRVPWPVDSVDKARVAQIRSMELGFRSAESGSSSFIRPVPVESLMITGDENLVNIQVVVQYRISDLPDYLFQVWDPTDSPEGRTLRDAAETALRGVVGSMTIDDILTVGRARVQEETKVHLQQLMDNYRTGLQITEVKLQAVEPPEPVQASFKDVVSAKEDRARIINEAKSYAEDLLPKARGQAQQMLREAEGYKESRIRESQGDTTRFLSMLREYQVAKSVTRQRLYLETMAEVLAKVDKVIVSREVADKALPLLPFKTLDAKSGNPQNGGRQ